MAAANTGDLLSGLPVWVQVASSLGMFAVAAIATAIGFTRRIAPWMVGHDAADKTHPGDEALTRIAVAVEGIHVVMQEEAREALIDREVKRRLEELKVKSR
jgi:hypothetical protein